MNRYASFFTRAARGALAAAVAAALTVGILCTDAPTVYAEGEKPAVSHSSVSSTDMVSGSDDAAQEAAYFTRVASVPANVHIPDFYQKVVNVSGMYIFTMPDGTVHKRIYGALDDEFGWYVPAGPDNVVYADARPVDTADDSKMYYDAVNQADLEALERQEFAGIIPPDEFVTELDEVRGIAMDDLIYYCVAGVVMLCLLITIGATAMRSASRRKDDDR